MAKKGSKASKGSKAAKVSLEELKNIHACTERALPPELQGEALTAAVNERADNVIIPGMAPGMGMAPMNDATAHIKAPAIALLAVKRWKPKRVLRVRFMGNPPKRVRDKIEEYAHKWEDYMSVRFDFGSHSKAEIRITCTLGIGSWSYLGTDALLIPAARPTMNYGWFTEETDDKEFSRTVLHEFGHAIGAIHEHSRPDTGIPWDKPAVYRYYKATQGWSKADVDDQVFFKYDHDSLNMNKYDKKSIMHYAIPKELLKNKNAAVGWNTVLSAGDRKFIREMYP